MTVGTTDNATPSSTPSSAAAALSTAASSPAVAASTPAPSATPTATPSSADGGATAPATTGAAATGQPASSTGDRGPIPFDRHESALRNARDRVLQEYGLASHTPQDIAEMIGFVRQFNADPTRFVENLVRETGWKPPQPKQDRQLPKPTHRSEDGKEFYSADALQEFVSISIEKALEGVTGQLEPLTRAQKESQQRAQAQQHIQGQQRRIADLVNYSRQNFPLFKEHEPAIQKELSEMNPQLRNAMGLEVATLMSFLHVMQKVILPGYTASAEQSVQDDNRRKATAAAGAVQPGTTPSVSPKAPGNVRELEAYMERLATQGA